MKYKRILAIGDIHGMYDKLTHLMDKIKFNPKDDLLIFLGDYVDRGPKPLDCLDYVMKLQKDYPNKVICLLGNHESIMRNCFSIKHFSIIKNISAFWIQTGGFCTAKEIIALPDKEINARISWLDSLPLYYEYGNFFFCHAGINPYNDLHKQKERDLLWVRDFFYENYMGEKTIVVGHTPVQRLSYMWDMPDGGRNDEPIFAENHIIFCDTGAYRTKEHYGKDGKLSCVDVLSKQFWQA